MTELKSTIGNTNVTVQRGVIIVIISFLTAIFVVSGNPEASGFGAFIFQFLGHTFIISIVATKGGRKMVMDLVEEWNNMDMNNQTTEKIKTNSSEPTKICSSCGWKNPKSNSYCHDCGSELTTASGSDQGD